jgi:hypothetical protein
MESAIVWRLDTGPNLGTVFYALVGRSTVSRTSPSERSLEWIFKVSIVKRSSSSFNKINCLDSML